MKKYRIIEDGNGLYSAQARVWFLPLYYTVFSTPSLKLAKREIENIKNEKIKTIIEQID